MSIILHSLFSFFFFNDTATTEIYTLSLHDALPICSGVEEHGQELKGGGLPGRLVEHVRREDGAAQHDPRVEHARHARHRQSPGPRQEHTRTGDREHVEEAEDRPPTARRGHDGRDEHDVEQAEQPRDGTGLGARAEEEENARGGRGDEQREREDDRMLAGHEVGRHDRPEREQQHGEPEPRPGEPAQKRVDVERLHYFIIVTSLKIGRYMATTRPPTTTPRNTIIIGSSSAVSAPTAVSTSSS